MPIEIIFNSGSGSIEPGSLSSFSYSEAASPLEPSTTDGGASQVSVTASEVTGIKSGNSHVNSKLLINNDMTINDDLNGMLSAKISKVSIAGGQVSITADTALAKLNVQVTAPPVHGTLLDAINAYCDLAYLTAFFADSIDVDMIDVPVNYPAWTGILWDKLKELCASVTINGSPIEVVSTFDGVTFRYALQNEIAIDERKSDYSVNIDSFDAAKNVSVTKTNSSYGEDKVVYEMSNYDPELKLRDRFLASINDSMQVEAGATVKKRFNIDATLTSINDPVCVSTINRSFPAPYAGTTGEYVVVGSDGLPLMPTQWLALGGSLIATLTENPGEIELTITAPPLGEIEKESGGTGLAPYSIGIESSGDGEYPALWLTGTGVFYNESQRTMPTGSDPDNSNEDAASTSARFLTDSDDFWTKSALVAQKACGPSLEVSVTMPAELDYGAGIGSFFYKDGNKFRVTSANYGVSEVSLTAVPCASFTDFGASWDGKTFANFKSYALDPDTYPDQALQFNEFTIMPLIGAQ
jgi:hypothetical protein